MHCTQCNTLIQNPGTHCPSCQSALVCRCPECGFQNLMGQEFCGSCNYDLSVQGKRALEEVPQQKPSVGTVNQYPLLSVELMNLEYLGDRLKNPDQLARVTRDVMQRIETQLADQNATIESVRDNVLFLSFQHGTGLGSVLSKALKIAMTLVKKSIRLQDVDLRLRVGMDLVRGNDRDPMTTVSERLAAQAGELVVSETIYQLTHQQLHYESLGPVRVQGKMKAHYRFIAVGPTPKAEPVQPVPTSVAGPSESPLQPLESSVTPMPAPQIVSPRSMESQELPRDAVFKPPVCLTTQNPPKKPNIGYFEASQAVQTDLQELTFDKRVTGKIIGISGEPGVGASTLVNLIRSTLPEDGFIWLGGGFYPQYAGNRYPLHFWMELVQNLIGLPLASVPQEQGITHMKTVLESMLGENTPAMPYLSDFIQTVLSLKPLSPFSERVRENIGRTVPHLIQILTTLSQTRPIVLVIENLEYADAASLELLAQLLRHDLLKHRISLLLVYTPDVMLTGELQQVVQLLPFKEYVLERADEARLITLAEPPLDSPWKKLPDELRVQLVQMASPLYLEEAFRWILMEGGFSLHPKTGKFVLDKKIKKLTLPRDLRQLVQDRLERQEELCRYVLQVASVLGERFSTTTLADLTQIPDQFKSVLQVLWQNGFVLPDVGDMARFRHSEIRQAVYDSMDADNRRQLHQLVADYYEQASLNHLAVSPILIAHHAELAGNRATALKYWDHTGVWLAEVGSVTASNLAFEHMQQLMGTEPLPSDQQKRLMETLALINMDAHPEYAKNLLLSVLTLDTPEYPQDFIQHQVLLSQVYETMGTFPKAADAIQRAMESLPPQENLLERVTLGSQRIWLLYLQGKYQEALTVFEEQVRPAIQQAERAPWEDPDLRVGYAKGELARARIALMQCEPKAFDIIDNAVMQCDLQNEPVMALHFHLARVFGMILKGKYPAAQTEMDRLFTDIERLSAPSDLMTWWGLTALILHCEAGDWENASMLIPNISYQAEQSRDFLAWTLCQVYAGKVSMGTGNRKEAQTLLDKAVAAAAEFHLNQPALLGWRFMVENEIALGNLELAQQLGTQALEISRRPDIMNKLEFYYLVILQASLYIQCRELKQAGQLLEQYWPAFVQTGYNPLIAEAAFLIGDMYGRLSNDLPEPHKARYVSQHNNFMGKARSIWQEQGNQYRLSALKTLVPV